MVHGRFNYSYKNCFLGFYLTRPAERSSVPRIIDINGHCEEVCKTDEAIHAVFDYWLVSYGLLRIRSQ